MRASSKFAERYGNTRRSRVRDRFFIAVVALVFVVVFGVWIFWAGLDGVTPEVDVETTGYRLINDRLVEVSYTVSLLPGKTAACAVQALNEKFAVVGWKVVNVEPSEQRTRLLTETVKTIEPSNTGLIYRCWLT